MLRDALVVGISSYQHLPTLSAPARDAEAIADQLETNGDFQVARLPEIVQGEKLRVGVKTPVTLAELEAALVKLFKPKGNNIPHTALFYFSGHGLQKEAGIREGYLATSDTNPAANFYGLSLFWLRRLLQESPVRQRIILLDCCHSGEILNFLEADPGAHSGTDRLFMAASREYESAYESLNGTYSVFTEAVLAGLDPRRLPTGIVTNYALTDWVSNALKGESQQPLFENSGSEIILTRCQNPETLLSTAPSQDVCPYRGLQPFEEEHSEYFFGREGITDQLLNQLRDDNFVAVVGASGSGKSSVVRAGLIHKLRRGQTLSGSDRWQIRLMTPTEQPFKSLANAFVNPTASAVERAEQLRRAEAFLQDGVSGLVHLVRATLMSESKTARFVLVIDQFEEIFTLCQGPNAEHLRHRFFNCLLAALRELGDRFNLIIVLRADFFSKCSFYKGLAEKIEEHLVLVTPLSYDQIKASILKPAEKVGLVCEPNLVYNILLDIVGAPGELPLLQYTLMELWQRRTQDPNGKPPRLSLDAYTELGGVRGTLQKRADEIFYSLSLAEQQIAKRIFIALTQLGEGTEDTRRRVLKSELVSNQVSGEVLQRVLEKLVIAKLVVTNQITPSNGHQEWIDQRFANVSTALRLAQVARSKCPKGLEGAEGTQAGREPVTKRYNMNVTRLSQSVDLDAFQPLTDGECQETVDIAHEALIRNWALLRSWLDENREMLRRQRRIERAAREWHNAQQPRSPEYLLHGSRLIDAEDYLSLYPHELSSYAQRYIAVSREESRRVRHELRLLQVSVPCTLLLALGVTFAQYQIALKNRAEKDYQLQIATSRQWSAISQSILQEPENDPTTALLISRLAAERGRTYEAEASLRAALKKLQLQANLFQANSSIQDFAVGPNYDRLATVDLNGTVRLWSLVTHQVERVLEWDVAQADVVKPGDRLVKPPEPALTAIKLSADGNYLLAVAKRATHINVWAVASGKLQHQLGGFQAAIAAMAVSPTGKWVAASSDGIIKVWQVDSGKLYAEFAHKDAVQTLAFSADGDYLVIASTQAATVWHVSKRQQKQHFTDKVALAAVAFSPKAPLIAIANQDGSLGLWQMHTGKLLRSTVLMPGTRAASVKTIPTMQFSPDGKKIVLVDAAGQLGVWHWQEQKQWEATLETALPGKAAVPQAAVVSFSPDSRTLAIADVDSSGTSKTRVVSIRDAATGQELNHLHGHSDRITAMQYTSDGSLVLTAGADGSVRLWATNQLGEFPVVKLADTPIQWATFQQTVQASRPGTGASGPATPQLAAIAPATLATAKPDCSTAGSAMTTGLRAMTKDGALYQWKLVGAPLSSTLPAPTTCSPGAGTTAAATSKPALWNSLGQRLKPFWQRLSWGATADVAAQSEGWSAIASRSGLRSTSAVGASSLAATITPDASVSELLSTLAKQARLLSVTFSADGNRLAIADSAGQLSIWQLQPQQPPKHLRSLHVPSPQPDSSAPSQTHPGQPAQVIRQLAFSADGQQLVGIGVDWSLHLWDVESGQHKHTLRGHSAFVEQAQFSLDGKRIVSASWDRTARVWDALSGTLVATIPHPDALTSARFSPDGSKIITTSLDGTARIVNAETASTQVILAGHRGAILDGGFSPNGQTVVTASTDGTARLWNAETGIEETILRPTGTEKDTQIIKQAFFSPDGEYVATFSEDGSVQLWVATWQGLLNLARDRTFRQLKPEECLRYLRMLPDQCPALSLSPKVVPSGR